MERMWNSEKHKCIGKGESMRNQVMKMQRESLQVVEEPEIRPWKPD